MGVFIGQGTLFEGLLPDRKVSDLICEKSGLPMRRLLTEDGFFRAFTHLRKGYYSIQIDCPNIGCFSIHIACSSNRARTWVSTRGGDSYLAC